MDGNVKGINGDLDPNIFTNFGPLSLPHNQSFITVKIHDNWTYGNGNGNQNDDGFYVTFFAFIRFVLEYDSTPQNLKSGFLNQNEFIFIQ